MRVSFRIFQNCSERPGLDITPRVVIPSIHRKRLRAHIAVNPTRRLDRRAFAPTGRTARRVAETVGRHISAPPNEQRRERHRRFVQTGGITAVNPHPGSGLAQISERGDRTRIMVGHVQFERDRLPASTATRGKEERRAGLSNPVGR